MLTLEYDLQLAAEDVEHAVMGAGFRDHMPLLPPTAGILVEVLARFRTRVHVLEQPGRWCSQNQ